jgi:hypothetical protein
LVVLLLTGPAFGQERPDEPKATSAPTIKRILKRSDEELRKQLLGVPEVGLDQQAAAALYKYLQDAANVVAPKKVDVPLDAGPRFLQQLATQARRPDWIALPWRPTIDAQLGKEQAELFHVLSLELRGLIRAAVPGQDVRPDPDALRKALESGAHPSGVGAPKLDVKAEDWAKPRAVPVLIQMLQVENQPIRLLLVDRLALVPGKEAGAALAQRAVFDLSFEVRERAVQALAKRPADHYSGALLDALRYPWPPAAEHAAEAIAALKLTTLSPKVAALLKLPDPARPHSATVNGRETMVVREVVRLNHMCNCMVCHAPSLNKDDLVRGRAPMPGEDPPPLYYQDRTGQFVRAEVTFLRQDFSVVQPVAVPGKWPGQQRFDYLVRERPLTDPELKAFVRLKEAAEFVQKDAILFTLRELTQRDGGRDYAGWADLLKRMAVEEKK